MDTLTREFTSFNCSSGTLRGNKEGSKPNNLNNFKPKDCNLQNGTTSNSDVFKRKSYPIMGGDNVHTSFSTNVPLTRSNSAETLCSENSSENCHSYDLVASSEGSLVSLRSLAESQASDNRGFYSFVNSQDSCNNSMRGDSAPNTPGEVKRPMPTLKTRNDRLTVPIPEKKIQQLQLKPINNDPLVIPDDFGKSTLMHLLFRYFCTRGPKRKTKIFSAEKGREYRQMYLYNRPNKVSQGILSLHGYDICYTSACCERLVMRSSSAFYSYMMLSIF